MKENKNDSKYDEYGQFLLSRENRFGITQGIYLNYKFTQSMDQQLVELIVYHSDQDEEFEILYPLTENDLDRLIAKLQEMREEIRQPEE
nr:MAG TPA: hypothetical protein [Caudoviricetes sp.]